jgi:amino acid transporter
LLPKTLPEFFQYAVHLVYAIVIGLSFEIAGEVVIPIEKIDTYFDLVNVGILFLAYFIVVTSWIGYFKSISDKKHKENIKGISRFGLDLFIVFIFYYLVSLTDPKNNGYYQDIFIFIVPFLYGIYAFWNTIKYYEYKSSLRTVCKDERCR